MPENRRELLMVWHQDEVESLVEAGGVLKMWMFHGILGFEKSSHLETDFRGSNRRFMNVGDEGRMGKKEKHL
ncbi:hypothetical protein GcM1_220050c [Golovinomyces cichoracearum]|uniref:Uncharacterized protein n=1 Tax=Golovinomyces cichoracearum TaxID=62708 RepID=A0A420IS29_9PEZI|nr:hypothetical protein GcM1_220050c [Golovinomyces cichoracearum]